jgi:hypothetical protein
MGSSSEKKAVSGANGPADENVWRKRQTDGGQQRASAAWHCSESVTAFRATRLVSPVFLLEKQAFRHQLDGSGALSPRSRNPLE